MNEEEEKAAAGSRRPPPAPPPPCAPPAPPLSMRGFVAAPLPFSVGSSPPLPPLSPPARLPSSSSAASLPAALPISSRGTPQPPTLQLQYAQRLQSAAAVASFPLSAPPAIFSSRSLLQALEASPSPSPPSPSPSRRISPPAASPHSAVAAATGGRVNGEHKSSAYSRHTAAAAAATAAAAAASSPWSFASPASVQASWPLLPSSASPLSSPSLANRRLRRSRAYCLLLRARCCKWWKECRGRRSRGAGGGAGSGVKAAAVRLPARLCTACTACLRSLPVTALCCLCLVVLVLIPFSLWWWLLAAPRDADPVAFGSVSPLSPSSHLLAMSFPSLFPPASFPPAPLPGYDPGFAIAVEEEEESYQRILRERSCAPADLACCVLMLPPSPFPAPLDSGGQSSPSSSSSASSASGTGATRRLAFLLLSDSGFVDMALNLVCSADAVAVPRGHWLVVAADAPTFRFFTLRGFNTVLLEQPRLSSPSSSSAPSQKGEEGDAEDEDGWGSLRHVSINREKVPLLHALLELRVDVLLIDADMLILHPLQRLFPALPPVSPSSSPPAASAVAMPDVSVMFDYPYGVVTELYSSEMLQCINSRSLSAHPPCSYLWEMNGGFLLLLSSAQTRRLAADMWDWLQQRPDENDQDALRAALKDRFYRRQLRFITDRGAAWPPSPLPASASSPDQRLSVSFLSSLLAPNGGLYLLEGSAMYREEALKAGVAEPVVVHLNWIVGYGRKQRLARERGLWFVTGQPGRGRCSSLHSLMRRQQEQQQQLSVDRSILHRNGSTSYPRLSPSSLDAAARASLAWQLSEAQQSQSVPLPLYEYDSRSSPLLLLFSSPKPLSSFASLPSRRSADADGLGARPGAEELSEEERRLLTADNARQLQAQLVVLRSWFGLSDAAFSLCQVLLFSSDPPQQRLADWLSFDSVDRFQVDAFGAPKLHSVFRSAQFIAERRRIPFLLYVNGDIALGLDALETAAAIDSYAFPEMLAVAGRADFNTQRLMEAVDAQYAQEMAAMDRVQRGAQAAPAATANLSRDLTDRLFSSLSALSRSSSSSEAVDLFLFSRSLFDWQQVPQFLLGRVGWDNWLLHWANSRKSATVIDVSATLTAVHMSHDLSASALQPNGMTNLRLAGQPSRRGLGSLQHASHCTVRGEDGSIRVVRQRPDGGHLRSLYDSAEDAAVSVNSRPLLTVVTVDAAFLSVFENWLLTWRKARQGSAAGLLLLSTHPSVSAFARSQAIPVFELAQGEKAVNALNGEQTAYLQIVSLRSKALLFLLEFGYDVLNLHVDTVWTADPLDAIRTRTAVVSPQRQQTDDAAPPGSAAVADGLADGLDLVGFHYASSLSACSSQWWNLSVGGLLLRHTTETLLTWRRISSEYAALVSRATMANQVNLLNLYEDWYLQYELQENAQLSWGAVCPDAGDALMRRSLSFNEYRQGALVDAVAVRERQQAAGMWLLPPDVRDAFFRSSLAPRSPPLRRLQDFPHLPSAPESRLAPLTAAEHEMLRAVAMSSRAGGVGGGALSVLSLHADNVDSPAVSRWLSRAVSLSLQHILLVVDSPLLLKRAASPQLLSSFPVLLPPAASIAEQPHLTFRLSQLLQAGFLVLLVDPDSVWFEQPLPVLDEQLRTEQAACDVVSHLSRNSSLLPGLVALRPSNASITATSIAHACYGRLLKERTPDATQATRAQQGGASLPFSCLSSAVAELQSFGLCSVCSLDADWFPTGYRLFESGAALDSGVWPVVSPARFVQPRSGRVKQFVSGWESWAQQPQVAAPAVQRPQRAQAEADSGLLLRASQAPPQLADHSVCPPSSFDASLRPHFTLLIKVLTFTRLESLQRLLRSLRDADFDGDRVHLEISIDALGTARGSRDGEEIREAAESGSEAERALHAAVVNASSSFAWPYGSKRWAVQESHAGLVGQWMSAWLPAERDDSTFMLVLEDDLELSRGFYLALKAAVCRFYFDPRQFDPAMFGFSLQRQRTVVGINAKTRQAMDAEDRRRRQDALLRQQQQQQLSNASDVSPPPALAAPVPADAAVAVDLLGRLSGEWLYRYQLVGTWGLLLFPAHWRAFMLWYREKTAPAASPAASPFTPCVPFLESSRWWSRRPSSVWSQWLIRFAFERGWYCLYSHWPDEHSALAVNHRERGENYHSRQGPGEERLLTLQEVQQAVATRWPQQLQRAPLFDFHFQRVHVNAFGLAQRHLLLNSRHWKRACQTEG